MKNRTIIFVLCIFLLSFQIVFANTCTANCNAAPNLGNCVAQCVLKAEDFKNEFTAKEFRAALQSDFKDDILQLIDNNRAATFPNFIMSNEQLAVWVEAKTGLVLSVSETIETVYYANPKDASNPRLQLTIGGQQIELDVSENDLYAGFKITNILNDQSAPAPGFRLEHSDSKTSYDFSVQTNAVIPITSQCESQCIRISEFNSDHPLLTVYQVPLDSLTIHEQRNKETLVHLVGPFEKDISLTRHVFGFSSPEEVAQHESENENRYFIYRAGGTLATVSYQTIYDVNGETSESLFFFDSDFNIRGAPAELASVEIASLDGTIHLIPREKGTVDYSLSDEDIAELLEGITPLDLKISTLGTFFAEISSWSATDVGEEIRISSFDKITSRDEFISHLVKTRREQGVNTVPSDIDNNIFVRMDDTEYLRLREYVDMFTSEEQAFRWINSYQVYLSSEYGTQSSPAQSQSTAYEQHTVQQGDSISKICKGLGSGCVQQVIELNPIIKNPNIIQAGWKLTVPTHKVAPASERSKTAQAALQRPVARARSGGLFGSLFSLDKCPLCQSFLENENVKKASRAIKNIPSPTGLSKEQRDSIFDESRR